MATYFYHDYERKDGFIGLYTAKIGGEEFRYVYLPHSCEPYGFSADYPSPFDLNDFDLNLSAFGLWDSVDELTENFKRYSEAKGFDDMKLTAIMPVYSRKTIHLSLDGAVINPQG